VAALDTARGLLGAGETRKGGASTHQSRPHWGK